MVSVRSSQRRVLPLQGRNSSGSAGRLTAGRRNPDLLTPGFEVVKGVVSPSRGGDAVSTVPGIDPDIPPSGSGCAECEVSAGWWFHLRRCAQCGHIGCCDWSPSQHASAHAREQDHPWIRSYESGEDWFYNNADEQLSEAPDLAPPLHHPLEQPTPGPAGRVPSDWQLHLHH